MIQTIKNFIKTVSNLITLFNNLLKKIFSSLFAKNINSHIMTLISLLYLGTLLFSFMWIFEYKLFDMFQLIILFLLSFAVFMFISDNYKFSNNKFIF